MTSTQQQDLSIFKDNSIISDHVLSSPNSYLTLISHVEGTQPTWFVNSLIESSLQGTSALINKDLNKKTINRSELYMISFLNNEDYYVRNLKKNGLDLTRESKFKFIDCFTDLFTKIITDPDNSIADIDRLFESIHKQISTSKSDKKIIILESPEILLTSTNISSIKLNNLILKLNRLCRNLYIITSHDHPQVVDVGNQDINDPSFETTDFLIKLHHKTNINIHFEPLTTGRADDITGILTVSKGSLPFKETSIAINEKSYTYNVSKESNIKIYFR